MRSVIAAGVAALLIAGCGGSSSSNGAGDGGSSGSSGGAGSSGSSSSSSSGGSSGGSGASSSSSSGSSSGGSSGSSGASSSGGGSSGSCSTMVSGTYLFHWTYVSGGTACMAYTPADKTSVVDQDAGVSQAGADAGTCTGTQTGCTYTETCASPVGDAGSFAESETVMINGDGSITGTVMISLSASIAGTPVMVACTFDLTSTKQ